MLLAMITTLALLKTLLTLTVVGQENFVKKYTYAKVMAQCFGNEAYLKYLRRINTAERECSNMEHISYNDSVMDQRPLQPHIFSSVDITANIGEIRAAIHNFTCLLQKMDIIDRNYNINYRAVLNTFVDNNSVEYRLRGDLRDGVNYCRASMLCLPEDGSAMPLEIQQIISFVECERRTRLVSCFRHDLRRNLNHFDLGSFPDDRGKSNNLVKMMAVVMGTDSLRDLEFF